MQIFAGKRFDNPIEIIEAFDNKSFIKAFSQIEILRKRPDTYLLGYIRYEAKDVFLGKKIKSKLPLLYFEVFNNYSEFCVQNTAEAIVKTEATISYKKYSKTIEKIKREIAEGNTYEVNYTYDYKIRTDLEGFEFYNYILPRQTTPYNAYIKNKYEEILSFSPELFFTLEHNKIKTKPMKGTVKRGLNEKEDSENIEFLKNDIKNRAENVMIVDLLRNDIGKIAKTGTVKVDKLFDIETHSTLHQMTSEISAELEEKITLFDIFKAIFPCGSITGAPKISTMKIIDKLEGVNGRKRGVYCGAIGLIAPKKTVFSVPIRTLQRTLRHCEEGQSPDAAIQKVYTCGVGGAIVWDSTAKEEWDETLTKIKFLNNHNDCHCEALAEAIQNYDNRLPYRNLVSSRNDMADFQLVETMLVENGKIKYKKEHFNRLKKTVKKLEFKFNSDILKIKPKKDGILRLLLNKEGSFETQYLPLNPIQTSKVSISKVQTNYKEPLLYHKTTYRPWYDDAMEKIKQEEVFDEIFFNEKGELTEGARSNIILQVEGKWYTPPINCGLLNGILRQELIKQKKLSEKILYLEDLKQAEKIFCINSVRGIVEVEVNYDFN